MKTALTIAGSDSSGGAGIQADLKVFSVLGVFGMSAITAITAQNTLGVKASLVLDPKLVAQQIDTVVGDIAADAVKTGMLGNVAVIEAVEDSIRRNNLAPFVCDPVMVAKSGDRLLEKDAVAAMRRRIVPLATVITPNRYEVAHLLDSDPGQLVATVQEAKDAARRLSAGGAKAVVIKAIPVQDQMVDLLFDGQEFTEFATPLQSTTKTHGSGCAFSAAITAGLATGLNLVEAIDQAKQMVAMAIQHSDGQGRGTPPVNVLAFAPKKK